MNNSEDLKNSIQYKLNYLYGFLKGLSENNLDENNLKALKKSINILSEIIDRLDRGYKNRVEFLKTQIDHEYDGT
jgi:hypothetical protein